ncbi:OmpA family protein [Flavobacterium sp.]|uniref:OmpA family protein n=1 Tax=Flavobacterium sp. TaxID=239 RepID=UPI002633CAEF|nr:OmpA family protein [Flavobacterium sp.]
MKKFIVLVLLFSSSLFSQEKIEVFFDFNEDIPNVTSTEFFNIWMNENRDVEVVKISGYCDSIDNSKYNKDLASRRIKSVLENLKISKIAINPKVIIDNNGKDFKQSKNQAENRKVVIYFNRNKLSNSISKSNKGDLIKLRALNFYNNSDVIVPKSQPVLKELLDIMKSKPKLKIEIQGHICCKLPNQEDTVSEARAKAVYDYLIKNKIDKSRMTYKGYGVSSPIYKIPEKNDFEADENRRVEILIVEN